MALQSRLLVRTRAVQCQSAYTVLGGEAQPVLETSLSSATSLPLVPPMLRDPLIQCLAPLLVPPHLAFPSWRPCSGVCRLLPSPSWDGRPSWDLPGLGSLRAASPVRPSYHIHLWA
jgi:hypothetical protein